MNAGSTLGVWLMLAGLVLLNGSRVRQQKGDRSDSVIFHIGHPEPY